MILSVIVAVGKQNQIGQNNQLLWHLSDDLKRFKAITKGHHILMGRKTYESIGKPLPNRVNIVVTRDSSFSSPGCIIVRSIEEGIKIARDSGETELFFCGGSAIYRSGLAICDKLYLTEVEYEGEADTFLPDYKHFQWDCIFEASYPKDDKNEYSYKVRDLIKVK